MLEGGGEEVQKGYQLQPARGYPPSSRRVFAPPLLGGREAIPLETCAQRMRSTSYGRHAATRQKPTRAFQLRARRAATTTQHVPAALSTHPGHAPAPFTPSHTRPPNRIVAPTVTASRLRPACRNSVRISSIAGDSTCM